MWLVYEWKSKYAAVEATVDNIIKIMELETRGGASSGLGSQNLLFLHTQK